MGRKILNRKEMRADFDAAERRKGDDEEEVEGEEEESEDDEEGEEEEEGAAADDDEEGDDEDEGDPDDEDAPKKKKKKKPAPKVKEVKPKRTRTPKVVRMRQVWGVFSNSNQQVAKYDYPKRKEADEHAARLTADKKQGNPFFVQPVKEAIEEPKEEKEKEKEKKHK